MKTNWQTKKLGEVCDFQNGFAFKGKLFTEKGLPVLRISNIQQDKISHKRLVFFKKENYDINFEKYKVKKGDMVIAMSGATTGKLAVNNTDEVFYLNQRVGKFKPKENLSKEFLYYFLMTRIEENLKISLGSAQPNLSTEQIKNLQIPLPPLPEQRRIVKILDEVFEKTAKAKENAERNLQNAKELFESYLGIVFVNVGDDWKEKKLGEVCDYDKTPHKKNNLPYVGLEDIESNSGRFLGSLNSKKVKSNTFHFSNKHVLYGRLRPYLNKVLLPNFEGHCSTEIFPIKPNKNIDKRFLFNWLISEKIVKKINATWTGARMPRANMNAVLDFIIPIPPLSEQKSIVAKLDALSAETKKLETIYKQKLSDLEELKKSVLKKAFEGKL